MNAYLSLKKPVLELKGARLQYQERTIFNNVTLTIHSGERVALIGESGSGKSTLLKALRDRQAKQIAWCPQSPDLVPSLSTFHNIYMGALDKHSSLYNLINLVRPWEKAKHSVENTARAVELHDQLWCSADQLSGGQQQRTNIARALLQERPIFLGDEPVSSVDEYHAIHLLQLICHRHKTLVLALHDIEQALRISTRIIGIKEGAIALDSPSDQLQASDLEPLYSQR